VLLAEGCRIDRAEITHSVVGLRSQIAAGSHIRDSILMGADYYEPGKRVSSIPIGLGPDCDIQGAILDKNARLGAGVVIRPFPRDVDEDHETWFVRDGIVVIPKDAEIPAGTRIAPD
jgi:glucose-1-phosphate adenylyltransferase